MTNIFKVIGSVFCSIVVTFCNIFCTLMVILCLVKVVKLTQNTSNNNSDEPDSEAQIKHDAENKKLLIVYLQLSVYFLLWSLMINIFLFSRSNYNETREVSRKCTQISCIMILVLAVIFTIGLGTMEFVYISWISLFLNDFPARISFYASLVITLMVFTAYCTVKIFTRYCKNNEPTYVEAHLGGYQETETEKLEKLENGNVIVPLPGKKRDYKFMNFINGFCIKIE